MLLSEILSKASPNIKSSKAVLKYNWAPITHKEHEHMDYDLYHEFGTATPNIKRPSKYTDIGSGINSNVFSHDKCSNIAIKEINVMGPKGEEDSNYQFLRLCLKHQDNPWFPKIYNVKQYPNSKKIIIKMEKLHPLTDQQIKLVEWLFMFDFDFDTDKESDEYLNIKKYNDKFLIKAMRLLAPLLKHYGTDLTPSNILCRKNGQLVIIDPLYPSF